MNKRLRDARIAAGFVSATDAIDYNGWRSSTYRAHENGQNLFNAQTAETYAKAYGVSAAWLLLGDGIKERTTVKQQALRNNMKGCSLNSCPERIQAYALLLKDEPQNIAYATKLRDCVINYVEILEEKF